MLRRRITAEAVEEFSSLARWRDEGMTDAVSLRNRFAAEGVIGEMDCVYWHWVTDRPDGFADADVAALERLRLSWRWR